MPVAATAQPPRRPAVAGGTPARSTSIHTIDTYARLPLDAVRGEGVWLYDAAGDEYLDLLAGISVSNVGHCHPHVVGALTAQAQWLLHVSNLVHTAPALQLAERLATHSLGDGSKVFLCNSGAEAVEGAIKLARRAKSAGEIVVVRDGFHGRTFGALSATPQEAKQAPFAPLVPASWSPSRRSRASPPPCMRDGRGAAGAGPR